MNTPFYFECPHCFGEAFGLKKMPKPLDPINVEDVVHKDNPKPGDEIRCQECGRQLATDIFATERIRTRPTAEELEREANGLLPGETIEDVIRRENGINPDDPCDLCDGTGFYIRPASIGENGIEDEQQVPCPCRSKVDDEDTNH